jgi:hypothetical protein
MKADITRKIFCPSATTVGSIGGVENVQDKETMRTINLIDSLEGAEIKGSMTKIEPTKYWEGEFTK